MAPPPWESIRVRKLEEQKSRIPQEWLIARERLPSDDVLNVVDVPRTCGILSPQELRITEDFDARSLAAAIRSRQLSALEVTIAFCKVRTNRTCSPRSP